MRALFGGEPAEAVGGRGLTGATCADGRGPGCLQAAPFGLPSAMATLSAPGLVLLGTSIVACGNDGGPGAERDSEGGVVAGCVVSPAAGTTILWMPGV